MLDAVVRMMLSNSAECKSLISLGVVHILAAQAASGKKSRERLMHVVGCSNLHRRSFAANNAAQDDTLANKAVSMTLSRATSL
jgi:hypothetical protein